MPDSPFGYLIGVDLKVSRELRFVDVKRRTCRSHWTGFGRPASSVKVLPVNIDRLPRYVEPSDNRLLASADDLIGQGGVGNALTQRPSLLLELRTIPVMAPRPVHELLHVVGV